MAFMNVYNQSGEIIDQVELSSDILETAINEYALTSGSCDAAC